jgi:hypothetical protein
MIVKICGVHTLDEALAALDTGADMLGFNFYEPSPRYIAPAACTAAHLRGTANPTFPRPPPEPEIGGRADLFEARGPGPFRRSQDQQRAGPGPARPAYGKESVIAETGAGQHGVASATAAALLGLECVVYMGTVDMARQQPNVLRMRLLGAEVRPVDSGSRTLKDAINEAIRDWVTNVEDTHYLLGSALGPHPYPGIVRDFQAVIGQEARQQILDQAGKLPDACIACVGGGSNAIGLFSAFLDDPQCRADRCGGRGRRPGKRAPRSSFRREWRSTVNCRPSWRPARHVHLRAARPGRADRCHTLHLCRAGLPSRGSPARSPEGDRPRPIYERDRSGGPGSFSGPGPDRGDPAGA